MDSEVGTIFFRSRWSYENPEGSGLPSWLTGLVSVAIGLLVIVPQVLRLIRQDFSFRPRRYREFTLDPTLGTIYIGIYLFLGLLALGFGIYMLREWRLEKDSEALAERRANRWRIGRKRKP